VAQVTGVDSESLAKLVISDREWVLAEHVVVTRTRFAVLAGSGRAAVGGLPQCRGSGAGADYRDRAEFGRVVDVRAGRIGMPVLRLSMPGMHTRNLATLNA